VGLKLRLGAAMNPKKIGANRTKVGLKRGMVAGIGDVIKVLIEPRWD